MEKIFGITLELANQKDTNGSDWKKSQMIEVSSDGITKRKKTLTYETQWPVLRDE
jgi:hypothetical protein